jgi:hypothetical protein
VVDDVMVSYGDDDDDDDDGNSDADAKKLSY